MRNTRNSVPVRSKNGGRTALIHVSRRRANEMIESGDAERISRLKDPNLVLRFLVLQREAHQSPCAIPQSQIVTNALAQVLCTDSEDEHEAAQQIVNRVAVWPEIGDDKAVRVGPLGVSQLTVMQL